MIKDPYKILDLPADSPSELLESRYNELKARYGEQRFLPGEEGNEGARRLSELEEAWLMIKADVDKKRAKEQFGDGDFGRIDDLIKKGMYDEAQAMLDAINDRNAEWHFLQSIIFYKREWLTECKKQLEMAVEAEPYNTKYKTALEKLQMVMGNPKTDPRNLGADPGQQQAPPNADPNAMMGANCLSNCCCAYCLTDCCCNAMRCCG